MQWLFLQGMILTDMNTAMHIPGALKQLDYNLFSKLNGQWHNAFLDELIPFVRESYLWIPFYFFLILFAAINFKIKGWYWALFFILNASVSDIVSSRLIKEYFLRLRPCNDPLIAHSVRFLVSYCPSSSSFTSSHAVNHFAAAMFIFITFRKPLGNYWALLFLWASVICYAQVYVGVHFPLDVFCGAIIGLILGYAIGKFYNYKIGLNTLT
ncbi:MAG: phosphatase PAP2 family protein [Ginsengibacter sp.]